MSTLHHTRRLLLVAGTALPLVTVGCGILFVQGPPENRRGPEISCTEGNVGPTVDLLMSGVFVAGALAAATSDPGFIDVRAQTAATSGALAVLTGVSAGVGYSKTEACQEAKQRSSERSGGAYNPGPAPLQQAPI